jgi:AbiV family abortive infection protein
MDSNSQHHDNTIFERILENAEDLIAEAKLLKEHGKLRRATFLVITAIEELEKISLIKEKSKEVYDHRLKHRDFYKILNFFAKPIANAIANSELYTADQKKIFAQLELEKEIVKMLSNIDLMTIRNEMLYIDKKPKQSPYIPTMESVYGWIQYAEQKLKLTRENKIITDELKLEFVGTKKN